MADQNDSKGQEQHQRGTEHEQSPSRGGGVLGMLGAAYQAVMRDGTLAALARDAIKDIQDTFHQVVYGQADHGREPGSPLTPLHSDIEKAREQYAPRTDLPSPGEIARGTNFRDSEQGQSYTRGQTQGTDQARDGQQMAQVGPWTQRELERRGSSGGGGGQNEPFVARILPDEQREQKEEIERGRGR